LNPLPLNPEIKIRHHFDALFGTHTFDILMQDHRNGDFTFQYSKRTGRIRNFSIKNRLVATLRTDGGLALTIFGATELLKDKRFKQNCVIPTEQALEFVRMGRSLFCKHVVWCGSNVKVGSDVAVIDRADNVVAVGRALVGNTTMESYRKGIAVKVREGIKRTSEI